MCSSPRVVMTLSLHSFPQRVVNWPHLQQLQQLLPTKLQSRIAGWLGVQEIFWSPYRFGDWRTNANWLTKMTGDIRPCWVQLLHCAAWRLCPISGGCCPMLSPFIALFLAFKWFCQGAACPKPSGLFGGCSTNSEIGNIIFRFEDLQIAWNWQEVLGRQMQLEAWLFHQLFFFEFGCCNGTKMWLLVWDNFEEPCLQHL